MRILLVTLFLFLALFFGCTDNSFEKQEDNRVHKVSGSGKEITISDANILEVEISGSNNKVTIAQGMSITQVTLYGINNAVLIPSSMRVKVINEGEGCYSKSY
jgi:uncharacterized protein YggE